MVKGVNRQRDMDLVNNDSMLQNNQDRTHNPKTVGSSPTRATNKFMGLDQKSDPFLVSEATLLR